MKKKNLNLYNTPAEYFGREKPIFDLMDIDLAIKYASNSCQVRLPRSRINGPRIINFTSIKAREFAKNYARFILEGRPEGYAAVRFEFEPQVRNYGPQPFILRFFDGEKIAHYTGDFVLYYHDGHAALVEIKPELAFAQPHVKRRLAIVEAGCRSTDIEFIYLSVEELEKQPRLDNLLFLYSYLTQPPTQSESLISILQKAGRSLPLEHLLRANPLITPHDIAGNLAAGNISTSHRFRWGPKFNLTLSTQ